MASLRRSPDHAIPTEQHLLKRTQPGAKREIFVHVCYPTARPAEPPVAYIPEAARLIEALGEEPLRKEFGEAFSMIAAGKLLTNSTAHAKPAAVSQKFPLLLFSHGVNTMAIEYTAQAEDLASHGNIIGAIDHVYDSFASVFQDGRVIPFSAVKWREGGREYERARVQVWSADIVFRFGPIRLMRI